MVNSDHSEASGQRSPPEDRLGADPTLEGRVIAGKFRIGSIIGAGASGSVYRADQVALGRTVAVKILRADLTSDPRLASRFEDEALAASRLNHPNTVSIIDYGQSEDGLLYLVMEFLRGQPLTSIIARELPLSPERTVDILGQVLSGIEEAHAEGVVHADLKADNIVVSARRGGRDWVKVVDFGIARLLERPQESADVRMICGTPEYMAPEVIRGNPPGVGSDIYALGVILYELLCGVTPFAGGSSLDVLTRHLRDAPVSPVARRPDLAILPALSDVALTALAKQPKDRYGSAAALRVALRAAVAGVAGSMRPTGTAFAPACPECGAPGMASFRFCPACGAARGPEPQDDDLVPAVMPATTPTRQSVEAFIALATADTGGTLPFVGRTAVVSALCSFAVAAGAAATTHIIGPPGSGKSRLIREVAVRLGTRKGDITTYIAGPDPTGLAAPFFPIRSVIAGILGLSGEVSHAAVAEAVRAAAIPPRDLAGIVELFGHDAELSQLDAAARRREVFAAAVRALWAAGQNGRAILVFEDVDRYDQPSLELIARFCDSRQQGDVRMIVTSTSELGGAWPTHAKNPIETTSLSPLTPDSIIALAGLGSPDAESGEAEFLANRTQGWPAGLIHTLRYVLDGGIAEAAPAALADVIAARLELLPIEAKIAIQAAAVIGLETTTAHLAATVGDRLPSQALELALDELCARALLVANGDVLSFEQWMVRDVVYDSTPADVRRGLHGAAAEVFARTGAGPACVGHHLQYAGQLAKAAEKLAHAGDAATRQLDDAGAGAYYQRALFAARQVMLAEGDDHQALFAEISVKLADSLRVIGEIGPARGVIEEAVGFCEHTPLFKAQLLRAAGHLCAAESDLEGAQKRLRAAIGLALVAGDPALLTDIYLDLAAALTRSGDVKDAIDELLEGIDLVTAGDGITAEGGPANLWQAFLRFAKLVSTRGQIERAIEFAEAASRHAKRVSSRPGSARAYSLLTMLLAQAGKDKEAEEYRRKAVSEMRLLGDRRATAELLLLTAAPTQKMRRINRESLAEARQLAHEIGWEEGEERSRHE